VSHFISKSHGLRLSFNWWGTVCGKFNQSDCHLYIDDNGQAVTEIATNIRKMVHVPTQVWKEWHPDNLFSRWFSALSGFNTPYRYNGSRLGSMFDVTLIDVPLVLQSIRTIMEATIERKMAIHIMMLWKI
jgi:hypothetical protein